MDEVAKPTAHWAKRYFLLYFLIMAAGSFVFLWLPPPASEFSQLAFRALTAKNPVVVVGPSTVYYFSRCDEDKRSIVAMLGDALGSTPLELSGGGQSIEHSVGYAGLALRNPNVEKIIVPIAVDLLVYWGRLRPEEFVALKALGPPLAYRSISQNYRSWLNPTPAGVWPFPRENAFDYEGRHYPDFGGITSAYFSVEAEHFTCPEHDAYDASFLEAYMQHVWISEGVEPRNIALLASLQRAAVSAKKQIEFVLLPVNYELLGRLNPTWEGIVRTRVSAVKKALNEETIRFLDLSDALPDRKFSMQWCGCTHLDTDGRKIVVKSIVDDLKSVR